MARMFPNSHEPVGVLLYMMNRKTKQVAIICSILAVVFLGPTASASSATRESRPFWTEKSAFVDGDELFVVGIGSHAPSVEEGRKQAFENGKVELMNYAQIMNLEAKGLLIETQMTYEESTTDGSVTVYRLLRVPVKKLLEIQGRVQTESRLKEQTIEKMVRDLTAVQQGLEKKTQRIEQQQREVESFLKQLEGRFSTAEGASLQTSRGESFASRLESIETKLTAREQELAEISRRAKERISQESRNYAKLCKLLALGMTPEEVRAIMGEAQKVTPFSGFGPLDGQQNKNVYWYYGRPTSIRLYMSIDGLLGGIYSTPLNHDGEIRGCLTP